MIAQLILLLPILFQKSYVDSARIELTPAINIERSVGAGETMLTQSRTPVVEEASKGVRLDHNIKIGNLMKGQIVIPKDSAFVEKPSSQGFVACTKLNMLFGKNKPCLFDADGDGKFEAVSFKPDEGPSPLPEPVAYERYSNRGNAIVGHTFKSEIIYSGSTGTALNLGYREFVDDLARPAFTEQLTIPLSASFPQDVRAKGVTFRIKSITGLGLTYSVVDAIPTQGTGASGDPSRPAS